MPEAGNIPKGSPQELRQQFARRGPSERLKSSNRLAIRKKLGDQANAYGRSQFSISKTDSGARYRTLPEEATKVSRLVVKKADEEALVI